ncbi:MAG: hypothetical protein OXT65_07880 [Alphaproteobacteria bacterium]|nr:hypothetical protein [Alphaproteobacteria bacterium]
MKAKLASLAALGSAFILGACVYTPPAGQAYWQRVEDHTAMYMTGPKAQQQLEEDIASCVHQVDELVELGALRRKTPPDTHLEYHRALASSGDLDWYDTPTRYGDKKVAHKDFQDFEGCMRHSGWERVRFVRYESMQRAKATYKETVNIRKWGGVPGGNEAAVDQNRKEVQEIKDDFAGLNK